LSIIYVRVIMFVQKMNVAFQLMLKSDWYSALLVLLDY